MAVADKAIRAKMLLNGRSVDGHELIDVRNPKHDASVFGTAANRVRTTRVPPNSSTQRR
jgi:hypothetical protein